MGDELTADQRNFEDFRRAAGNFVDTCQTMGTRVLGAGRRELAGELFVLREEVYRAGNAIQLAWSPPGPEEPDEAAPPPARARRTGEHRHTFDAAGVCAKPGCGKQKSARGRKAADEGAPAAPPADTRTLPLRPVGDAAADRYADGGLGSSGMRR